MFDSREGHGGLFITASAEALENRQDAEHGYAVIKELKERFYGEMGNIEAYLEPNSQRIYCARPQRLWVNKSDRDKNGVIIRDRRYEVKLTDLLQ